MSLTIPKAPVVGGRAPNFSRDNTGGMVQGAVAQFGQNMAQVGLRMENDRQRAIAERAQIDMTRELGELRQSVSQSNDPTRIDAEWSSGVADIRARYIDINTDDPTLALNADWQQRVTNSFDELANRHALAIADYRQQLQLRNGSANWVEYANTLTAQSGQVDNATYETLLAQGLERINERLLNGEIDQFTAVQDRIALRREMGKARAIELMNNDPTGFVEITRKGETFGQSPDQIATWRGQAQGRIDRQLAADQKAAEAAAAAETKEIGKRLAEFINIVEADRLPLDAQFLNDPKVQAHPDYAEARAALDLSMERAELPFLTLEQLDAVIADEQARPVEKAYQAERLTVLENLREKAAKGWNTDPIGYADSIGMAVPEFPADLAAAAPVELAEALAARAAFGGFLEQGGYTETPSYLTAEETQSLRAEIATADPARRADLAGVLAVTIGRQDPAAYSALVDDPVFAFVGGYLAQGGNAALAQEVFTGQTAIDNKNVILPPLADRLPPAGDVLTPALGHLPGGQRHIAEIRETADALYAARIAAVDPTSDTFDKRKSQDVYRQALHEAMGGTGAVDSPQASGGIQTIRDLPTALPVGVHGRDVDMALEALAVLFAGGSVPLLQPGEHWTPDASQQELATQILTRAGSGHTPMIGDQPMDVSMFRNVRLQAIAPDTYRFVYASNNGLVAINNETGGNFEFSLKQLLREVGP